MTGPELKSEIRRNLTSPRKLYSEDVKRHDGTRIERVRRVGRQVGRELDVRVRTYTFTGGRHSRVVVEVIRD